MKDEVFTVEKYNGSKNTENILCFLMPEYKRIFEKNKMLGEPCVIYNDANAECPMLIINETPVRIRLSLPDTALWAKTIYQLSHELCHYAIRQYKVDKATTLNWFEEIFCEAMSLYALYYSQINWGECSLSRNDYSYRFGIKDYLNKVLNFEASDSLKNCTTIDMLREYNRIAEKDRAGHLNERNELYEAIKKEPCSAKILCDYQKYIVASSEVVVDFEKWYAETGHPIICTFGSFQKVKSLTTV